MSERIILSEKLEDNKAAAEWVRGVKKHRTSVCKHWKFVVPDDFD